MVDSKNNIHITSLIGLAIMAGRNVKNFRGQKEKVLRRSEEKKNYK